MLFKELSLGKIFTFIEKDGHAVTAIKSGGRQALILQTGEEVNMFPTKTVDFPAPIRGGEFAIDHEGRPMIAERLKNGSYLCEYVQRVGREILPESQVALVSLKAGNTSENQNELNIILKRLEKSLKNAQNALEMGKSVVEELE